MATELQAWHCDKRSGSLLNATVIPAWLLLLIASLISRIQAESLQVPEAQSHQGGASFRRLLTITKGNITTQQAERILQNYGIDDFGGLVYIAEVPTCPIEALPASATGQLFIFCDLNEQKRSCQSESGGGSQQPLVRMTCQNSTCLATMSISESACMLEKGLGFAPKVAADSQCVFDDSFVPTDNVSNPFTPRFLQPVGTEKSLFDCVLGAPPGTSVRHSLECRSGFFQIQTLAILGGEAFVEEGETFQCVYDGRCRSDKSCCEGDALYQGHFICYLPAGARAGRSGLQSEGSAGRRGGPLGPVAWAGLHWGLLVWAGAWAGLLVL